MHMIKREIIEVIAMLIIDKNSVYEIDEECLKRKRVSKECGTAELVEELRQREKKQAGQKRKNR